MPIACDLRIFVEASTLLSMLRLMLLASVASLSSTVATNSFMDWARDFFVTSGAVVAALVIA